MKKAALVIVLFCICLISCTTYEDQKIGKVGVWDGYLKFENSNNQLIYRLNRNFTRDTEIVVATWYDVTLPKKIKYSYVGVMKSFFDYGDGQFVIIIQNEEPDIPESSKPTEEDWKKLVIAQFDINKLHKLKLDNFNLKNDRNSVILNKDNISVILYNIKKEKFERFVNDIKTIQIRVRPHS